MGSEPGAPRVGIGVLICKADKVLVGKRKGSHGGGEWALPGGKLEMGESFEDCARREVLEETGIQLGAVAFQAVENSVFSNTVHYVTLFMRAEVGEATEAQNLEPDKCEGWQWVGWDDIPQPTFLPLKLLLQRGHQLFPHR
ncbi:hypothetical protein WJX72_008515 [[Myrmecia] bisecta]|uniref:Nudix hydrolase domain-containing protein n=1 Tax=[Myrmecia] bisecta TaxID=41462 RepID=A0AAW1Q1L4_9CHLO